MDRRNLTSEGSCGGRRSPRRTRGLHAGHMEDTDSVGKYLNRHPTSGIPWRCHVGEIHRATPENRTLGHSPGRSTEPASKWFNRHLAGDIPTRRLCGRRSQGRTPWHRTVAAAAAVIGVRVVQQTPGPGHSRPASSHRRCLTSTRWPPASVVPQCSCVRFRRPPPLRCPVSSAAAGMPGTDLTMR